MKNALEAVSNKEMTLRQASSEFNIPKSTLHDHISGRVHPGAVSGAPRYLDDEEEDELVRWLEGCAQIGYAKSIREVRAIVGAIVAKKNNLDSMVVSHGWWDCFRQQHPHLTLRSGETLAYRRAVSTNRVVIDKYFDLMEEIFERNNLLKKPNLIFNADETGMPLQHRPGRRIAVRGQKHVHVIGSGDKTQVTVLACANATGYTMPPMIIYKKKNLTAQLRAHEVEGTIYGLSLTGWMDGELFHEWFHCHFLQYAPAGRPLLLLLDGHSSHYKLEFIREASTQGVIVFCLPPNTTHVCQPLDVSPFNALKVHWDNVCDKFMSTNPGKIVTLYQFSSLFHEAWKKAMVPETIIPGFKVAGVYPLNRRAVRIPGEVPTTTSTPTAVLARREGICYMPFLSSTEEKQHARPLTECKELQNSFTLEEEDFDHFTKEHDNVIVPDTPDFSKEEEVRFAIRYENGYDLKHDDRYNQWLIHRHPESTTQSSLAYKLDFSTSSESDASVEIQAPSFGPLPSSYEDDKDDYSEHGKV